MWSISSDDYVKAALHDASESIDGTRWRIPKDVDMPMSTAYRPELDESPKLESYDITLYLELIGIIRWTTEIGRVDVMHEISILSQYQAIPREGHFWIYAKERSTLPIHESCITKGRLFSIYFEPGRL